MNNKLEVIGIDHGWSMMKTVTQVLSRGKGDYNYSGTFWRCS